MKRFTHGTLLLAFALALAACGGSSGTTGTPTVPGTSQTPTAEAECVRKSFPCTFAQVPVDVLAYGEEVSNQIASMLSSGQSLADIAVAVEQMPDIAEVLSSDGAIRFRVDGGRPIWFERTEHFYDYDLDAPQALVERQFSQRQLQQRNANPDAIVAQDIVGGDSNNDGREDQKDPKRALFMFPIDLEVAFQDVHLRDFYGKKYDELPPIRWIDHAAQMFRELDSYAGNVTVKSGAEVTLDTFKNWSDYDVIGYNGHGSYVCDEEECYSSLQTGVAVESCDEVLESQLELGLTCGTMVVSLEFVGVDVPGRLPAEYTYSYIKITPEFFRQNATGDMESIIYFGSCSLFEGYDLTAALGLNGFYLGWTGPVGWEEDSKAGLEFFDLLAFGADTETSYRWLRIEGLTTYEKPERAIFSKLERFGRDGLSATAGESFSAQGDGASDLRARQIIEALNSSGQPIVENENLFADLVGVPDDGEHDELDMRVKVDGIEEGTLGDYAVRILLNGEEVGETYSMTKAQQVGEMSYLLEIEKVPLGLDIEETIEGERLIFYELEAVVDLPEGGVSRYFENVVFEATYWDMTLQSTPRAGEYGDRCASYIKDFQNPEGGPGLGFYLMLVQFDSSGSQVVTVTAATENQLPTGSLGPFDETLLMVSFDGSFTFGSYRGLGTMSLTAHEDDYLEGTISALLETIANVNPPEFAYTDAELSFRAFEVSTAEQAVERCRRDR